MAKKIADKLIAETYGKKGCNVSQTCTALNISRKTFYEWKEKRPKLAELLDEKDEQLLDFAESKLISHINDGDTNCLIFYLKTKGKKRGYIEKTESDINLNQFEELMKSVEDDDEE